jgi:aryl-alcohol dehydrogenase-like predicted oxidoreductase
MLSSAAALIVAGQRRVLAIGTWAWSPSGTWGKAAGTNTDEATNGEAFRAALDAGLTFFDTAEVYGESEERIGRYLAALPSAERSKVAIASKYIPLPWHLRSSNVVSHCKASLHRLGLEKMELYQIHGPALSIRSVETWAHGLADVLEAGLAVQVGVSNMNSDQVQRTAAVLEARGHKLASNQIEFSLLKRRPETSGLIAKCASMGVAVMAYSPLAMGRLTGKVYAAEDTKERWFARGGYTPAQLEALLAKLREVGAAHGDATPAQVALAWTIAKGTVPIAGAKTAKQARENVAASEIELSAEEVASLDALSVDGQRDGGVPGWQTSRLDEL